MRARDIKARAEEFEEQYDDAMTDKFNEEFREFIEPMLKTEDAISEDDIQGFMDSFTVDDISDWCFDRVQSELDDIGDMKYQQCKDDGIC